MKKRKTKSVIHFLLGAVLLFVFQVSVQSVEESMDAKHGPKTIEELRVRDGLPNVLAKLEQSETVTIAYLGGSITEAAGWRVKTFSWFEEQYPDAELIHIEAAVSGTGADFAACRLQRDLISKKPDLVFVEYRVNLGGGFEARAIEGVVRQIWNANPETDICLVYTIGQWMLDDMENGGKQNFFGEIMETLANVYGIPSIDFAPEVLIQKKAGKLTFKADAPEKGKLHFTKDGVHPVDAGHELYAEVVARSILKMKESGETGPHILPEPIVKQFFVNSRLMPISAATASDEWKTVDVENDEVYTRDKRRSHDMLNGALKTSDEGATLTVNWTGTLLGLTLIPLGEGIEVEVSINGQESVDYTFAQTSEKYLFAQFKYLPEQKQGDHAAVLKVTKLPEGTAFYCGQFLVHSDVAQ